MAEWQLPKLYTAVRFRSPALKTFSWIFYPMSYFKYFFVLTVLCLPACATGPTTPPQDTTGQTLAKSASVSSTRHTVTRGETLWRISQLYQVDLDDLVKANKISDSQSLNAGQILVIPGRRKGPQTNFTTKNGTDELIWPASGKILCYYHQKRGGVTNKGIDIAPEGECRVQAVSNGRIVFVGRLAGYGQTVILDHKNGLASVYSGLDKLIVRSGDDIQRGQVLAQTKDAGAVHFEIRRKNKPQNPLYYLN